MFSSPYKATVTSDRVTFKNSNKLDNEKYSDGARSLQHTVFHLTFYKEYNLILTESSFGTRELHREI